MFTTLHSGYFCFFFVLFLQCLVTQFNLNILLSHEHKLAIYWFFFKLTHFSHFLMLLLLLKINFRGIIFFFRYILYLGTTFFIMLVKLKSRKLKRTFLKRYLIEKKQSIKLLSKTEEKSKFAQLQPKLSCAWLTNLEKQQLSSLSAWNKCVNIHTRGRAYLTGGIKALSAARMSPEHARTVGRNDWRLLANFEMISLFIQFP